MGSDIFIIILLATLGLVLGSFAGVLVYRVPRGLNIAKPRSHCEKCNRRLKFYENIPIFSYLLQGGKCRQCGENISVSYPILEILSAFFFVLIYIRFGFNFLFYKYIFFCYTLLVVSFTDVETLRDSARFETGVIPNVFIFVGLFVGLAFATYEGRLVDALAGAACAYLVLLFPAAVYSYFTGASGMGEGDFGLFAMVACYTGLMSVPVILFLASFIGLIVGIVLVILTKNKKYAIPFAPMLSFGGVVYIFFGEKIVSFIYSLV